MVKKILFLSTLPPPHYGASIMSEICLEILQKSKNFQVRNIKLNYSKSMNDVGKINLSKFKGFFKVMKQISNSFKEFSPDFIYFAPATKGFGLIRDFLFVQKIKKYGVPFVFHIHSRLFKGRKNKLMYQKMFKGEKAIILGKELLDDVEEFFKKEDINFLPNAIKNQISEREFKKLIEEKKKRPNLNLLFLSNMNESKGWPKLLEACEILNKKLDFTCNFVGEFPSKWEKERFYESAKEKNLGRRVNYLGKKTGKDKRKIFEQSDIFIFPTEYPFETFGVVIIESMMFGIPVIANGIATIPSIISDNETGFVLKKNSPEEISEKILQLSKRETRENFSEKSRKRFLEKYELGNYQKNLLKIIGSLF
ncbi:MAG: glycosyltransferase family 4 protein [Nanoarchaeota archaeon]|nr:glycosyltransferase family 4 protein [Nanoarchaeota archaeon]